MKPKQIKDLLIAQIKLVSANAKSFCIDSEKTFRERENLQWRK